MVERFTIKIVLESQRLIDFGHFTNAICVEFPACVVTQTEASIEACAADQPDISTILLALSKLATCARNAVAVGDAVSHTMGRADPVRLDGGPIQ